MQSTREFIKFGVPQDSVLGPLLFVLYTADLAPLITEHRLHSHLYADDTQVYGWCQPTDVSLLRSQHGTVLRRRVEVDVQHQAAAECTEDEVHLVRSCTPSSHY